MEKTIQMLKEIEVTLLQADLRISMLNGKLDNPTSKESLNKILALQIELESVHQQTTKMENSLLKKINQALLAMIRLLDTELEIAKAEVEIKMAELQKLQQKS